MIQLKLFPENVQEKDVWDIYAKQFEKLGYNVSPRVTWEYWIKTHMHKAKKITLNRKYSIHIIW